MGGLGDPSPAKDPSHSGWSRLGNLGGPGKEEAQTLCPRQSMVQGEMRPGEWGLLGTPIPAKVQTMGGRVKSGESGGPFRGSREAQRLCQRQSMVQVDEAWRKGALGTPPQFWGALLLCKGSKSLGGFESGGSSSLGGPGKLRDVAQGKVWSRWMRPGGRGWGTPPWGPQVEMRLGSRLVRREGVRGAGAPWGALPGLASL